MAAIVAIDHHRHHHHPHHPPPSTRPKRRSFPHPDWLHLDHPTPTPSLPTIPRSLSTPCFPSYPHPDPNPPTLSPSVRSLLAEAAISLSSSLPRVPAAGGLTGGAFFLLNRSGSRFAVVKPAASTSPAAAAREAAAYLLDHGGFAGVPPTTVVRISSDGGGDASIQRYVPHECDAGEVGPSRFPVASVHRIGALDVRVLNVDRHAGNILVGEAGELVPIDHGLCLPEFLDGPYFEWLHWPQATIPFSESEAEYISALDPFKDADLLRSQLPALREASLRVMIVCTVFLKRAARAGLCLAEIGSMMTWEFRGAEEGQSTLETICRRARDGVKRSSFRRVSFEDLSETEWEVFLERFEAALPEAFRGREAEAM